MDSIISYFLICWQKIFNYKGRARRLELGSFILLTIIMAAGFQITEQLIKEYIYSYSDLLHLDIFNITAKDNHVTKQHIFTLHTTSCVYLLISILPLLSTTARRLQDLNKSKYWILYLLFPFCLILIVFIGLFIALKFGTDILNIPWLEKYWFYIIVPFLLYEILLILKLLFQEGKSGENQYGQSPK